jgi:hypothetical protein
MNTHFQKIPLSRRILLFLFILSGFGNTSQAQSSAPEPIAYSINIEAAMRVWQERYHRVTGQFITWPANLNGDPPGQYPKNCFYAEDLQDPARAAALVQSLAAAMATRRKEEGLYDTSSFVNPEIPVLSYYRKPPASAYGASDAVELYQETLNHGFNLAEVAFVSAKTFQYDYAEIKPDGPLSNITTFNYVNKFTEIAYLLSQTNILVQPANYLRAEAGSRSISSTARNADLLVAQSEALSTYKNNAANASFSPISLAGIGIGLETRKIVDNEGKVEYISEIV